MTYWITRSSSARTPTTCTLHEMALRAGSGGVGCDHAESDRKDGEGSHVPRRHIQENDGDAGPFLIWQELGLQSPSRRHRHGGLLCRQPQPRSERAAAAASLVSCARTASCRRWRGRLRATRVARPDIQRVPERYVEVVKRAIMYMTAGMDLSPLFTEMVMVRVHACVHPWRPHLHSPTLTACGRQPRPATSCRRSLCTSSYARMPRPTPSLPFSPSTPSKRCVYVCMPMPECA
jgi:hypothetical protein